MRVSMLALAGCAAGALAGCEKAKPTAATARSRSAELLARLPPGPLAIGINRLGPEAELKTNFDKVRASMPDEEGGPPRCTMDWIARLDGMAVVAGDKTMAMAVSGPKLRPLIDNCVKTEFPFNDLQITDENGVTRYGTADGFAIYAVWEGEDTVLYGGAMDAASARAMAKQGGAKVPGDVDVSQPIWGSANLTEWPALSSKLAAVGIHAKRAWFASLSDGRAGMTITVQLASTEEAQATLARAEEFSKKAELGEMFEATYRVDGDKITGTFDMTKQLTSRMGMEPSSAAMRNVAVLGVAAAIVIPALMKNAREGKMDPGRVDPGKVEAPAP
jgi:hypothetical protein